MNRAEHLAWAKSRALEYCDCGEWQNAIASMLSDLGKHVELKNHAGRMLMFAVRTPNEARKWIEGFN